MAFGGFDRKLSGINVIYGVAEPVQPPRMGKVRKP